MSYSRRHIIWGLKLFLRNSCGLDRAFLKVCHQITINWCRKLAQTRRKCFFVSNCVSSHYNNPYPMNKSRRKSGNLIRKWALNTMICMLEHWNVTVKNQFLTQSTIMRRQPIHSEIQYDLVYHPRKCGTHQEPHECVPQKLSPHQTCYVTEQIRSTTQNRCVFMSLEQYNAVPTKPRSSKYDLLHNPKPSCDDGYKHWMPNSISVIIQFNRILTTEHIRTRSGKA